MTEPSQYFKGRTVQEQMNEVIGYVDVRAEEVAAAKADDVLEPAEQAKTDAIAAKEAAEDARDATLAALPTIQQDIADLKAEDVSLDGRLDTVELKVQTAEGNIVTIQGQIVALQTADGQNVKLTGEHAIGNYAVLLTGNQTKSGQITFTTTDPLIVKSGGSWAGPTSTFYLKRTMIMTDENDNIVSEYYPTHDANGQNHTQICTRAYVNNGEGVYNVSKRACLDVVVSASTGKARVVFVTPNGTNYPITDWLD